MKSFEKIIHTLCIVCFLLISIGNTAAPDTTVDSTTTTAPATETSAPGTVVEEEFSLDDLGGESEVVAPQMRDISLHKTGWSILPALFLLYIIIAVKRYRESKLLSHTKPKVNP